MAARTNYAYNQTKDCLQRQELVERSLQLSPNKDPTMFEKTPMGIYDPISQEMFFQEENKWVQVQQLQKYHEAYEWITQYDASDISEGTSKNTVPNSLLREETQLSLLSEELEAQDHMQHVSSPTTVPDIPIAQKKSFLEQLLDDFLPST